MRSIVTPARPPLQKTCVVNESGTVRILTNKRDELSFKTDGLVKNGQEFYKVRPRHSWRQRARQATC